MPIPPNDEPDQLDDPGADREQGDHERDDQQDAADAREHARARRRDQQPHHPEHEHLAARGRLLAELLHGVAELVRAALGERQRGLHHLAQRGTLLRVAARQRLVEVGARGLGVVALRRAGAEDRLGRHAVPRLALELLVGPRLELRDRRQGAHLHLHLDLLLLRHGRESLRRFAGERAAGYRVRHDHRNHRRSSASSCSSWASWCRGCRSGPQRGVDSTLGVGQRAGGKAPGPIGSFFSKSFGTSRKATNKSASTGRRARGKMPL